MGTVPLGEDAKHDAKGKSSQSPLVDSFTIQVKDYGPSNILGKDPNNLERSRTINSPKQKGIRMLMRKV